MAPDSDPGAVTGSPYPHPVTTSAGTDVPTPRLTLWDALLPRTCVGCGRPGGDCCGRCAATLPLAPDRRPPPGVDVAVGWLAHHGAAAELVARAKFHHGRTLLDQLGGGLGRLVAAAISPGGHDAPVALTWAPTTPRHRRHRGFDQAEVLATAASRQLGPTAPTRATLRRLGTSTQTGRPRDERLVGPQFEPLGPTPTRVVLVDDVWTTGATLSAAADALRRGGAEHVTAVVLAVRP